MLDHAVRTTIVCVRGGSYAVTYLEKPRRSPSPLALAGNPLIVLRYLTVVDLSLAYSGLFSILR